MAHRIYTGSFAALENRLMQEFEGRQLRDPLSAVSVLVGSNLLATYIRRRFAEEHRAAANIRYYTFLDLAAQLARQTGFADTRARLPWLGASAILESILAEHTPDVFKPVSGYLGFRDALLDTFRDLRDAGIDAIQFENSIRPRIEHQPDRRDHLVGLVRLYREFRKRVRGFRDVDDDFRAAIGNTAKAGSLLGTQSLIVYGVYDATGQQIQLLASLKESLELVYFIPCMDDAVSSFALPFLQDRMAELKARPEPLVPNCPRGSLGHLWSTGFGLANRGKTAPDNSAEKQLTADGSFALVSAPGESRVALEAIRELISAVRDGVIGGFHEAAIILRQPQEELPLFIEACRLRGIPFFVHGGASLAERPLSKAVLALFSLAVNSFSRQSILTAMEYIGAALPADESAKWDITRWRALTNDPRFLSGAASWDASTRAIVLEARRDLQAAEAEAGSVEDEEEGRRILSAPAMKEKLSAAEALENGWKIVRRAVAEVPAACSWREWAESLEKNLSPLLGAAEDWPSFSAVVDELRSLDLVCRSARPEHPVSLARFVETLKESVAGLERPMGRFQRNGVNLLSINAARGLRFPLVIIPGLEEGKFPARLRQDPLLLDAERRQAGSLPLKLKRGEEEKLLFDMAARSAEKRLVLLTSRLDEGSDRECLPSQFFMVFACEVRGKPTGLRDLGEGAIPGFRSVSLENPAPGEGVLAIDENEIRIRAICRDPGSKQAFLAALAGGDAKFLAGPLDFDRARWLRKLTPYDGRFQNPELVRWAAEKSLLSAGQISASRVEQYAKCPYQFYLKRVMGIERWEEDEAIEAMDPLAKGSVVHKILERFLKEHAGGKFLRGPCEALQRRLEEQGREILEEARPAGLPDLLWEIERDRILQTLRNWLVFEKNRAADNLLPVWLERPFGVFSPQETSPPLSIQAGRHRFDFRGRIDRIDLSPDGKHARVIDYKTGKIPVAMKRKGRTPLMSGERIQIAIYREALASMADLGKLEHVAGEYLHIAPDEGDTVPIVFANEELLEAGPRLRAILEVLASGIEDGAFFARTRGLVRPEGHCKYCDFLPICGKDREQRAERKIVDPAVSRFLEVQAIDGRTAGDAD
jgi:ATP-dependent helicase/nuclease subunit B